jgi:hypothetical protein
MFKIVCNRKIAWGKIFIVRTGRSYSLQLWLGRLVEDVSGCNGRNGKNAEGSDGYLFYCLIYKKYYW